MKKIALAFIGVALMMIVVAVYRSPQLFQLKPANNQPTPTASSAETTAGVEDLIMSQQYEFTATQSGQTAMDLLEQNTNVEGKVYDFGVMITTINDLGANATNYWAFYLNDEYAKQAADKTILQIGDKIKFVYEAVSAAPVMNE